MNRFGLAREIPEGIKRAVRQRDGFGCVICGKAVIDYEHFDPEYVDAQSHDPGSIVLLCIEHHGLKTRGVLSRETIRRHMASPKCKEIGYSFGPFDIGVTHPKITMGRLECDNVPCILRFDGEELLAISPPEEAGGPFLISARIRDENGNITLDIVNNEWRANADNWDVDVRGREIAIRRGLGDIVLRLRSDPPHGIIFERVNINHKGHSIRCQEGQDLVLRTRHGIEFSAFETKISGSRTAIECDENGLRIGVGGGSMRITSATIGGYRHAGVRAGVSQQNTILRRCWCGVQYPHSHWPRR